MPKPTVIPTFTDEQRKAAVAALQKDLEPISKVELIDEEKKGNREIGPNNMALVDEARQILEQFPQYAHPLVDLNELLLLMKSGQNYRSVIKTLEAYLAKLKDTASYVDNAILKGIDLSYDNLGMLARADEQAKVQHQRLAAHYKKFTNKKLKPEINQ